MFDPLNAIRVEQPRPAAIREHRNAGWFAVLTVCFGAFMGQMDASIVTLAFPAMQDDFDQPLAAVQWVSLSYLLVLVGLLTAAGRIADASGRKQMYLYGFALFTAASIACGFAPNLGWLIAFRVLQAVGATMLQANSVALVVTSVPRDRMRTALGWQAAAQALGLAAGPVVGGLLVGTLGWQWVFWIKLPIGVIGLLAGWFLLPRTRERTPLNRFDLGGLLLMILASAPILLGLSGISGLGMPVWVAVLLIAGGLLTGLAFIAWESRAADPLVHPSTLRPAAVSVGLIGALCGYLVLFGPLTLIPQVLGAEGRVGVVLSCLPLGFGIAAVGSRLLPAGLGARARTVIGAGIAALGLAGSVFAVDQQLIMGGLLLIIGLGLGVFIPTNNATIMSAVPARLAATGGGLVNVARSMGTAFGVAAVTLSLHAAGPSGDVAGLVSLAGFAAIAALTGIAVGRRG